MSGCLNSGADGSWHVRQTTNPVITPYTKIAKANSAMAHQAYPESAASIANPDVATLASSQPRRRPGRR